MAIDKLYFEYLAAAIKLLHEQEPKTKTTRRVGCLSYPDILVSRDLIIKKFPELALSKFKLRDDLKKISLWHGMPELEELIETTDFFNKVNLTADYFDFAEIRGEEIITDLNIPIDEKYHAKYDLVVDTGTLEHCFNVGIAFQNMCKLAKIEGLILSAAPMTKINHGFWNFSPCAYENFYAQNKFKILFIGAFYKQEGKIVQIKIDGNKRQTCPSESIIISIARRTELSTFKMPIQKKYL